MYNKYIAYLKNSDTHSLDKLNDFFESIYSNNDDESLSWYDLNHKAFIDFPIKIIIDVINNHISGEHFYEYRTMNYEIIKYIYSIWNTYANIPYINKPKVYPHNELYECIFTIKEILLFLSKCTKQQYIKKIKSSSYPFKSRMYYSHWLYCYFPLLDDCHSKMIHFLNYVFLDDAQDSFMFGLYCMNPNNLFNFMIDMIPLIENKNDNKTSTGLSVLDSNVCFDIIDSGTGANWQFMMIIKKLKKHNYDLLNHPNIQKYSEKYNIDKRDFK